MIGPRQATVYTAMTQDSNGLIIQRAELFVKGARGGNAFPERNTPFSYPLSKRALGKHLNALADHIAHIFQDIYLISVDEYAEPRQAKWIFLTARRDRPDLLDPHTKSIAARRISYRVIINTTPNAPKEYQYQVETLLEYRKRAEKTWRVEDNGTIAMREAQQLHGHIESTR